MTGSSGDVPEKNRLEAEIRGVFARTWQWICHVEKLSEPGSLVATHCAPSTASRQRAACSVLATWPGMAARRDVLVAAGIATTHRGGAPA